MDKLVSGVEEQIATSFSFFSFLFRVCQEITCFGMRTKIWCNLYVRCHWSPFFVLLRWGKWRRWSCLFGAGVISVGARCDLHCSGCENCRICVNPRNRELSLWFIWNIYYIFWIILVDENQCARPDFLSGRCTVPDVVKRILVVQFQVQTSNRACLPPPTNECSSNQQWSPPSDWLASCNLCDSESPLTDIGFTFATN